jgi:hypothetical protein
VHCLILAIDHNWQYVPHGLETPEMQQLKAVFEAALTQAISDRGVDLICEECDPCRLSIAQRMAYEHHPRIPWKNINMSAQERFEAGIWDALLHRPYHTVEDPPNSGYYITIDHRIPADAPREQFFAEQSIEAAEAANAGSILIPCGDMHVEALREILEARHIQTETNHDLIQDQHWQ